MALINVYVILFVGILTDCSLQQEFEVPEASVELLYPVGFAVSVPDTRGIRLFAFHGKLNEEFTTIHDGGYYSADITSAKNNRWTYTDRTTRFKIGDAINYWLYFDYYNGKNKRGYMSEFRTFNVTECPRNVINEMGLCNGPHPSHHEVPNATIEILYPKGFTVSIPDREGIVLFAFHGKINEPFDGRESGHFSRDINSAKDGRWTFTDRNALLIPGDVLYYWLYVDYAVKGGRRGYLKENEEFVVPDLGGSCNKSLTTWNGREVCAGQLLLNEEFDTPNLNNWRRDVEFADEPDYEFVIYDKFEDNLEVKGGELHIKPTLVVDRYGERIIFSGEGNDLGTGFKETKSCPNDIEDDYKGIPIGGYSLPPVFSSRITSNNSFKYGRVEIRAKLPKGDWIYPQLLLTPSQYEYGNKSYDSGEIRIAFAYGNRNLNDELQGRILLDTTPRAREYGISKTIAESGKGWSDRFHTFSVLWKPDSLVFMVDNREYGEIKPPEGGFSSIFSGGKAETAAKWKSEGGMAPFDREMRIKIGVGVGGHSFPDSISSKPYTNVEAKPQVKFYKAKNLWKGTWNEESELIVNYVKVYAL